MKLLLAIAFLCLSGCSREAPIKFDGQGSGLFFIKDGYRQIDSPNKKMTASLVQRRAVLIEPLGDDQLFPPYTSSFLGKSFEWTSGTDAAWDADNRLVAYRNGASVGFFRLNEVSREIEWIGNQASETYPEAPAPR